MSNKIKKDTNNTNKKNNNKQPQDGFLDNQLIIIIMGILLFTAGVGVNIARAAWGAATWKAFIWNIIFILVYMIVFEMIKIYRLYHWKQEQYEREKKKAKKAGRTIPQKNKLDLLFEAANSRKE